MSPKMYEGQLDGHHTIVVLKYGLQQPWNVVPEEKCIFERICGEELITAPTGG